jgi:hypothetical protein
MHLSQDPRGSCFVQSCCILFKIRAREWVRAGLGLAVLVQSLLLDVLFLSLVRRLDPRVCLRVSDMLAPVLPARTHTPLARGLFSL